MQYRVVDTNVPLTAAGYNDVATADCRLACIAFMERILTGQVVVVLDDSNEALNEYGGKVSPQKRSEDLAGQFLIHLYSHIGNERFVRLVELRRTPNGQFVDYPDKSGSWQTDDPKCKTFDDDDKKWVAIAGRFRRETGEDAPIASASDRCWSAFELMLNRAGLRLDFVCNHDPNTN